jgi:hypothetical protein
VRGAANDSHLADPLSRPPQREDAVSTRRIDSADRDSTRQEQEGPFGRSALSHDDLAGSEGTERASVEDRGGRWSRGNEAPSRSG